MKVHKEQEPQRCPRSVTVIGDKRPPVASGRASLYGSVRGAGAATVAAGPSRAVQKVPTASTAPKGAAKPPAATKAGGTGAPRRQAWDLKGKVSNMEGKIRNCQTKVRSVNENEILKGSVAQSHNRLSNLEREVESQKSKICGYEVELQALCGVREDLKHMTIEKNCLQRELSDLEAKYKVMETLRDSQEAELQTLKEEVRSLKETVVEQKDELHAGEMERRRLHNMIQELKVILWQTAS
nr:kinesin-like protein KIFC1 isoform X2 [Nothobranchius furzeri]